MADLRESGLTLLSDTAGGITAISDMSVEAIQTLFTVPTGKTCILSHAILEVSADAGANLVMTIGQGAAATAWCFPDCNSARCCAPGVRRH